MGTRSWSNVAVHLGVTVGLAASALTAVGVATGVGAAGAASSFVPITPCRLMDTRPAPENVGARNGAIAAGETYDAVVWGTNGNCTIPSTATAVSMNVTAIAPTAASFLTVYPSDAARPLAASLNWVAGQAPTPNAVTTTLSATGRVSFYNLSGTVHLTADIVGYYQPADLPVPGPQGPTGAAGATGPAGGANRLTPAQIGMERWYLDPGRRSSIALSGTPTGIAFDGSSIWVTRQFAHAVSRIDPATSTVTATIDLGATAEPTAITWAAGRIWVINLVTNTVVRINPALNAVTATIALGSVADPNAIAYDGTRLLVANSNGTVTRIDPTTNTVIGTFTVVGAGDITAIAWDGSSAWVTDITNGTVHRLDTTLPATVGSPIATGSIPSDIAIDGTSVWVANAGSATISRIDPTSAANGGAGAVTDTITGVTAPRRLTYDGISLYAASTTSVMRVNPTTMAVSTSWALSATISDVLYDGTNLWVARSTQLVKGVPF